MYSFEEQRPRKQGLRKSCPRLENPEDNDVTAHKSTHTTLIAMQVVGAHCFIWLCAVHAVVTGTLSFLKPRQA